MVLLLSPKCLLSQTHFPSIDEKEVSVNLSGFLLLFPWDLPLPVTSYGCLFGVLQSYDPNEADCSNSFTNTLDPFLTSLD